ncbi:hypothetical protein LRS13_16540 [Svornostia abyssi]|uniref:Uncharacterized protein n=1 Tax=Svornostia abyssi TaxID=2898438 RepID=A0ABY5PCA5_9ACTN|nr:hypothetical protein LRS13_16540 [Parviterribacteraceae bacterium J379]
MASRANFEAVYAPVMGVEMRPLTDETNTIRPPAARSLGSTALVTATWPTTLMSSCRRRSSVVSASTGPATTTPALLTTASSRSGNASASAVTCASSVTSTMTAVVPCGASPSLRTPA